MDNYFDHKKLWAFVRDNKLTGAEIARKAGIHASTFSNILNGRTMPRRKTVHRIAAALGVKDDDLAADQPTPRDDDEQYLLELFRQLDKDGRHRAAVAILDLVEKQKAAISNEK